jgi:kynurenine formamidase
MNKNHIIVIAIILHTLPNFGQDRQPLTKLDVLNIVDEISNWGRWGANDELGAINLITPEKRRQAAKLVRDGISVSMARDVETEKAADNPNPFVHTMLSDGQTLHAQWCSDNFSVSYHGFAHSHIDALCHYVHEQTLYNGISAKVVTSDGARKLDIHNLKEGIFTRGILVDLPALKGLDYLEPGTAIYPEDLEAWEKKAGVTISSGDAVLIYTGRWARREAVGPWSGSQAGLHATAARWLGKRDISVLGSDGGSEVSPSGIPGVNSPVHLLMLHALGVPMLDNLDLEALGAKAAELNRWDFLLTVAPLPVQGGTGSPLNPIATF